MNLLVNSASYKVFCWDVCIANFSNNHDNGVFELIQKVVLGMDVNFTHSAVTLYSVP